MKNIIYIILSLLINFSAFAQTEMKIRKTNQDVISIPISDIDSIYYETTNNNFTCGDSITDLDGNTYETVEIGDQCWMAENMKYETPNSVWYDNDSVNGDIYGRLYNFDEALLTCSSGWSIPSDEEWKEMEMELGMSQSEADATIWRGTDQGIQMKSTNGWYDSGNGTNSSGFTALPGGGGFGYGTSFMSLEQAGSWWSSTDINSELAYGRSLRCDRDGVYRGSYYKINLYSVRCIKDND